MGRKGKRGDSFRPDRPKKRKFCGNKYTVEQETSYTSASAAKLSKSNDEEVIIENNYGNCILEFFTVFTAISSLVVCATCKEEIKFSRTTHRGIGFKIALQCSCENIQYIPSSPSVNKAFEINRRMVFAMRLLGVGREGINIFCNMMDICQGLPVNSYYSSLENLHSAASAVYDLIISKAIDEEKNLLLASDPDANPTNFTVSADGTWKRQGFTSLFGVTTLVAKYSKKIIDTVVKSSFCQCCDAMKNKKHEEFCTINHKGSAGKLEVDAVVEMFGRSVEKHGVKYVKYIANGDTETFKGIIDMDPYDGDPIVENEEFVGQVQTESSLSRCLGSQTQKHNESLNSLIWTFAPEHIHAGLRMMELATFIAVCIFNEGWIPMLKIMSLMGIKIGPEAHGFATKHDNIRFERSGIGASDTSKETRTARFEKNSAENAFFEVEEGPLYETGIAD